MTTKWDTADATETLFGERMTGAERPACENDELVAGLRRAEAWALGATYDRHHLHVRNFARRLVGESAAAEDLVHEVFVSLPRAIARFRFGSSLRTFLVAIAVNHARHHVRSAARRRAAMVRLSLEPIASVPDPQCALERGELARALTRALDELPIDQRVAFVLCEVEERTAVEVALIVDAPEATVRTRLFAARRKLRELLEKEGVR